MIINAIIRGLKAAIDAVAKAIAWLLIALGLWVPLVYSLIFLVVVVAFTDAPLETTGTLYFLGLFISFIGALWFSLAFDARKGRKRKAKESCNIADVKRKNDKEEKPIDPPRIETAVNNELSEEQDENSMNNQYDNEQRRFNNNSDSLRNEENYDRRQSYDRVSNNNDWQKPNSDSYYDSGVRSEYDNGKANKSWLNENPYTRQNNNYEGSRSGQGYGELRADWQREENQKYEMHRKPEFEPYNTDQSQKPDSIQYNNEFGDSLKEQNNPSPSYFNRDYRRSTFEPYGNDTRTTRFEQNYGRNDSSKQDDNSTRANLNFDRGYKSSFEPYPDSQRYNDDSYNGQSNNDVPYNNRSQRFNDDTYNGRLYGQDGQAYEQRRNDRYNGYESSNGEPPKNNGSFQPSMPYNNYNNGYNNTYAMDRPENQGTPPPRNPYEKPRIFRLREDPDMLVYEYSDRLDYYRRTPYGNEYVRTKIKH